MSYEIIYDKQFIRTAKGFIPMVLAGSNNCYDANGNSNRMRRSRDWQMWNIGRIISTEKELLDYTKEVRQSLIDRYPNDSDDVYNDKSFGYFSAIAVGGTTTRKTTFGNFQGVFKVGIAKALTVEELKEHGISTRIFTSHYDIELNRKFGYEPINFCPNTSQELQDFIDENESKPIKFYLDFYGASESTFKRMRFNRGYDLRKEAKKTVVTQASAIVLNSGAYFVKFTKYGYKYSFSSPKYYYKKSTLNIALKKVNERIGNAKVETITFNSPREVML